MNARVGMIRPRLVRTLAPTAWSTQPLQQHQAEGDGDGDGDGGGEGPDGDGDGAGEGGDDGDGGAGDGDGGDDDDADLKDFKNDDGSIDFKKAARYHERQSKKANARAVKAEAAARRAKMTEDQAAKDEAAEAKAEALEARTDFARTTAAKKYNFGADDLDVLDDLPLAKIDAVAKRYATRMGLIDAKGKPVTKTQEQRGTRRGGSEVDGSGKDDKPKTLQGAIQDALTPKT